MADGFVQRQIEDSGKTNFANRAAEEAVIANMIMSDDGASDIAGTLSSEDFYFVDHAKLFRCVQAVTAKRGKIDLITVDAAITELFPAESSRLSETMVTCVRAKVQYSAKAIQDYVQIIKELSLRRRSITEFEQLLMDLRDPTQNVSTVLDRMIAQTGQVTTGKHRWTNMQDMLLATYEYLEKRQTGQIKSVTTGITGIDDLIGGFFGGELTVIGARPSVGKSAFGANIALAAARKGIKVAVVSREMTDVQYGTRMISRESLVDGMKLRKGDISGDDWDNIAESLSPLADLPIEFMFSVRTIEDLTREVQRKVSRGECNMLVVDYLQLVETQRRFDKDYQRVGYISASLKHLATDCNIPVIALAQVNRESDGQMPTLRSLRDSGNIEQDADGVVFLHRPLSADDRAVDPRDKEFFETYKTRGLTYLTIAIAKQRQGMTGFYSLLFDPAHMMYLEIDRRGEPNGGEK